jgi:MFS family permease
MSVPAEISKHNFFAFLWHAGFLALAQNFMDVDTIVPSMVIESGGNAMHVGIMTAIMMGGSSFTQLFFAPYLSNKPFKKKYLLTGINIRILSIFALALLLFYLNVNKSGSVLWLIFIFISLFAVGGAFANISYTDIFGKSVNENKRKTYFSIQQILSGSVVVISAFIAKKVLTLAGHPVNYAYMFFIGATILLISSGGQWSIKEVEPSVLKIHGFKHYFETLRSELRQNRKLIYFLGFINTQGIIISFLPFVILYSKEIFNTQSSDTGFFLLFKVIGIVTVSMLVFVFSEKVRYTPLLYINAGLSVMLVLFTALADNPHSVRYIFIFGGVAFSLYTITMNGLLLEVSGKENRALYTGFAGAGYIIPAIFPLAGGWIISKAGYNAFFIMVIVIVVSSLFFIHKINCKK